MDHLVVLGRSPARDVEHLPDGIEERNRLCAVLLGIQPRGLMTVVVALMVVVHVLLMLVLVVLGVFPVLRVFRVLVQIVIVVVVLAHRSILLRLARSVRLSVASRVRQAAEHEPGAFPCRN